MNIDYLIVSYVLFFLINVLLCTREYGELPTDNSSLTNQWWTNQENTNQVNHVNAYS